MIELAELPHSKSIELLKTGAPVYLLVNPVEYHGPHLPLKNDHQLSLGMARELHLRLNSQMNQTWPMIMAAPLHFGAGPAPGPGTVSTSFIDLKKMVMESCNGLRELGAKRVVVMTFHGDPLHNLALDAAVKDLHQSGIQALAPFSALLNMLLSYQPGQFDHCFDGVADPIQRKFLIDHMTSDFHAGFFETSLMLHFWPEMVSTHYHLLPPCPEPEANPIFKSLSSVVRKAGIKKLAAELDFVAIGLGWVTLKNRPGYSSSPHLANAESGKAFAEETLKLFVAAAERAFTEIGHSPEPLLKWIAPLTLNGRLAI